MRKVFAISDLHFDHENIIKYCQRPFENKDEMNEAIIKNWNSTVNDDDEVYVVGDFCFSKNKSKLQNFCRRLKGHKHLILGNHDYLSPYEGYLDVGFVTVTKGILTVNLFCKKWIMCHYHMADWEDSFKGSVHIFGHNHWKMQMFPSHKVFEDNMLSEKRWNVCADANFFTPVDLKKLDEYLEKKPTNFQEKRK